MFGFFIKNDLMSQYKFCFKHEDVATVYQNWITKPSALMVSSKVQ